MTDFYAILTADGITEVLDCVASNRAFAPTKMAVGDSNGSYYEPEKNQAALKNSLYKGDIFAQGKKQGYLYFCLQVPPSEGDYTIREVGLFSQDGKLWAVAKYPETLKTKADETSNKTLNIEIQIELSDMILNTIVIDNSGNLVTRQVLEEYQALNEKGKAGGYAPLDNEAKVPLEHLPSTFTLFCFNSGAVDENGEAALLELSTVSVPVPAENEDDEPEQIEHKIITLKAPAVYTDGQGNTITITEDLTLDVTDFAPGEYSLRVQKTASGIEFNAVEGSKVYRQKNQPENPADGDLWHNLSVAPELAYIYFATNGENSESVGSWEITNQVEAGRYTVSESSDLSGGGGS